MRTKNNHIALNESRERFLKFTEGKRVGYCNWEVQHTNFRLECWNIKQKDGGIQPHIFQIWTDGAGLNEYVPS